VQIPLWGEPADGIAARLLDEILAIDVTTLTPVEALTRLHELQQRGRGAD
jgi:hypothetical protein